MKTIQILTSLIFCFFVFSCDSGDSKVNPINGTWYTFEKTVILSSETHSSDAKYLEERINIYYAGEIKDYDIVKYYDDETVKTVTTLKSDPGKPVSETQFSYEIEGDIMTINDRIYGSVIYEYIITNKIITLHGTLNHKRITDIADQLGIMISVPADIEGTIKIKDYR
ncbi:MAG: hypothetical protein ACK5M3_12165 [Dysgonomonas sp.]